MNISHFKHLLSFCRFGSTMTFQTKFPDILTRKLLQLAQDGLSYKKKNELLTTSYNYHKNCITYYHVTSYSKAKIVICHQTNPFHQKNKIF